MKETCSLTVYLSTTKFSVADNEGLSSMNVPICVAQIGIIRIGFSLQEKEVYEHKFSVLCEKMAEFVKIDTKLKTVKIFDAESFLIDYQEEKDTEYSEEFFKRWEETHILLFEFQVYSLKENLFTLKGLWDTNQWRFLEIKPTNKIVIEKL